MGIHSRGNSHFLPADVVLGILADLRSGMTRRKIAKRRQVGRESVRRIANGNHVSQRHDPVYKPCPECGVDVVMPCHACFIRTMTIATHEVAA